MNSRTYSVVIVDDSPLFCKGMQDVLLEHGNYQVIGTTNDEKVALGLVTLRPHLVILDLDAVSFSAIELLREIRYRQPSTKIIVTTAVAKSSPELLEAIRLETKGYLLKNSPIQDFLENVQVVMTGGTAASEKITTALAESLRTGAKQDPKNSAHNVLTRREFDVLCCVSSGLSNHDIARYLQIRDGTVKVHVKHMLKKMNFRSRVEAAVWASERGYRVPTEDLEALQGKKPAGSQAANKK